MNGVKYLLLPLGVAFGLVVVVWVTFFFRPTDRFSDKHYFSLHDRNRSCLEPVFTAMRFSGRVSSTRSTRTLGSHNDTEKIFFSLHDTSIVRPIDLGFLQISHEKKSHVLAHPSMITEEGKYVPFALREGDFIRKKKNEAFFTYYSEGKKYTIKPIYEIEGGEQRNRRWMREMIDKHKEDCE